MLDNEGPPAPELIERFPGSNPSGVGRDRLSVDQEIKTRQTNLGPSLSGFYRQRHKEPMLSLTKLATQNLYAAFCSTKRGKTVLQIFRHFALQHQLRVRTAESTPSRFSRRFRARLPVMAEKSGPITSPRFGSLEGWAPMMVLNQSSAT